jgi:hypothetical protein
MADLNFNALARPGPRSFYQGFEQGQENRVTSEINQMKLDELRRDRDEMLQLREQLKGLGQDPDPTKYLDALARTGNPKYVQMAIEGKQKIKDLEAYANLGVIEPVPAVSGMPTSTPGAIAAPSTPAPRTERGVDIYGKPVEVEVGGGIASPGAMGQPLAPLDTPAPPAASPSEPYPGYNASIGMAPPSANALAPSAPAPAPTGTNALAAQPNAAQAAATQKRIEQLLGFARTNPRFANQAMAEARLLQDQLELYSKRGPAPAAPSEIGKLEAEIAALTQNGAEPNDPRIVARRGKISQLSGAGAPLDITRAMTERDRLIASGRSQTDPDVAALNAYIRKQTTPTPGASVTVKLPPLESAEQKGQGELNIKNVDEIRAAAKLAQKTLPAIETQARILDQGFTTGFGTEFKKAGASVLAALGVQNAEKFATNAQTFIAATQQAVLQKQLEQKGTQTAADADRITQTGAQLGNTVNGNRFIIDVAKAQLKRDIDQRDFYAKWWSNKKTYEGAEDAWYAGEGGKSLFDRPELKKYVAPTAAETDKRQQGLANIFGGKK